MASVTEAEFCDHFAWPDSLRRGHYTTILDTWGRYFPAEQMHLIFQEDLRRAPRETMERVFDHVGISREIDWSRLRLDQTSNAAPNVAMSTACREVLEKLYGSEIERL